MTQLENARDPAAIGSVPGRCRREQRRGQNATATTTVGEHTLSDYHAIHTESGLLGWLRGRDDGFVEGQLNQKPWIGEGPFEEVLRDHPDWQCSPCSLRPGEFHPRIEREASPGDAQKRPKNASLFAKECQSSITALLSLFSRLEPILRIIEPSTSNMATYGHELRHMLILASTEVESGLKAVLIANKIEPSRNGNYSIRDYRKLLGPMRLDEWKVELDGHHELGVFVPFLGWEDHAAPAWWTAYNRVKHDRESELHQATFHNVLLALSAAYVVVAAQFGLYAINAPHNFPRVTELIAATDGWPEWAANEFYIPPDVPGGWDAWTPIGLKP